MREPSSSTQQVVSNVPSVLVDNTRAVNGELRVFNNPLNNGGFVESMLRSYYGT